MKLPTENEIRDLWLQKYHNTNIEEIITKYPKEILESSKWFEMFPCTQEQNDEWVKEAKQFLKKKYKTSKWMVDKVWWMIGLHCSPYVKREEDGKTI